jgi:hypothetical protein
MRFAQARKPLPCAPPLIPCLREAPTFLLLRGLRGLIFLRGLRVSLAFLLTCRQSSLAVTAGQPA